MRKIASSPARPRLGFLGVGWIGRHRMTAIAESGLAEVAAVSDASEQMVKDALAAAPGAAVAGSLDELLRLGVDGVVIATPSALHAEQSIAALEAGVAVFCQKPLGRSGAEVDAVLAAARKADRLLGVDLSYRHVEGARRIRELVAGGELGDVYAVELAFHNAYGPDKPWFYDARLSGGGCVMDLGIHLVDLALWTLGFPKVERVASTLLAGGAPLKDRTQVEDYASAQLSLAGGASLRLACSWKLPAGRDCVIEASFYGTKGGASLRNVNGSFYDFVAERYRGTSREVLVEPPDAWGGRAAVAWAEALARSPRFDPGIETIADVQKALDRVYG